MTVLCVLNILRQNGVGLLFTVVSNYTSLPGIRFHSLFPICKDFRMSKNLLANILTCILWANINLWKKNVSHTTKLKIRESLFVSRVLVPLENGRGRRGHSRCLIFE